MHIGLSLQYADKCCIPKLKQKELWNENKVIEPNDRFHRSRNYAKLLQERRERQRQREEIAYAKEQAAKMIADMRFKQIGQLFAIYVAQASDSYRKPAKKAYHFPPIYAVLRAFKNIRQQKLHELDKEADEKHFLPKLPFRNLDRS